MSISIFGIAGAGRSTGSLLKKALLMLLRAKATGDLIEVARIEKLISPFEQAVEGRNQAGQEEQDTKHFKKTELTFPTGEPLPRCWVDANCEVPAGDAQR